MTCPIKTRYIGTFITLDSSPLHIKSTLTHHHLHLTTSLPVPLCSVNQKRREQGQQAFQLYHPDSPVSHLLKGGGRYVHIGVGDRNLEGRRRCSTVQSDISKEALTLSWTYYLFPCLDRFNS